MRTTSAAFHLVSGFSLISMLKFQFESKLFCERMSRSPVRWFLFPGLPTYSYIYLILSISIFRTYVLCTRKSVRHSESLPILLHIRCFARIFFSSLSSAIGSAIGRRRFSFSRSLVPFGVFFFCSSVTLSLCGWLPATSNKIFSKLEYFLFSVVHSLAVRCGSIPAVRRPRRFVCLPLRFSARGKFAICDNEKGGSIQKYSPSAVTCELQFFFADN